MESQFTLTVCLYQQCEKKNSSWKHETKKCSVTGSQNN